MMFAAAKLLRQTSPYPMQNLDDFWVNVDFLKDLGITIDKGSYTRNTSKVPFICSNQAQNAVYEG